MDLRSVLNRVPGPVKRAVKNALYPDLLEVGSAAPNWALRAHDGNEHTLPEHDWAVLVFYPADDTPAAPCSSRVSTECRGIECAWRARVWCESSVSDRPHGVRQQGLLLPLLVDDGARVAALYGQPSSCPSEPGHPDGVPR